MSELKVGDIVARKSYGGDIHFKIVDIKNAGTPNVTYVLRGMLYRIEADCYDRDDLVKQDIRSVYQNTNRAISDAEKHAREGNLLGKLMPLLNNLRSKPGTILHIDSSRELMDMCLKRYRQAGLKAVSHLKPEEEQPSVVRRLLNQHRPDILVVTGHDGIKKNISTKYSLNSYRNSRYYVQSVTEARKYEPSPDKLCIFAGACQSYFEAIMQAGANFASAPGRILINGLDPAIVSEKVATTPSNKLIIPSEVAGLTISGSKGIGGIVTKGRLM